MALQPASITFQAFFGPTPPSISIHGSTPLALHITFRSLIFWTWDSMKLWPPKPGFTDIMRTIATGLHHFPGVLRANAAVDLDPRIDALGLAHHLQVPNLLDLGLDEALATEARVH
eukprot:CAMPEP_0177352070 /NCGR_PEP_ID=MMETSP0368-20130122/32161_1 /TAXON_ID=447022 ORGANISM="Scrippsiella hangoei-like, Strain SHHI-4" /NCGR_SAMPLE_ID=MMETSP0368 /ASSEMBLY_ACC=CAM_ASM_000363 /LENGTH=115 /DNA_ID=CAMNT_0018814041 /DNA_START=235 /DNA_END=582 /DNA_ORIENTATION=+